MLRQTSFPYVYTPVTHQSTHVVLTSPQAGIGNRLQGSTSRVLPVLPSVQSMTQADWRLDPNWRATFWRPLTTAPLDKHRGNLAARHRLATTQLTDDEEELSARRLSAGVRDVGLANKSKRKTLFAILNEVDDSDGKDKEEQIAYTDLVNVSLSDSLEYCDHDGDNVQFVLEHDTLYKVVNGGEHLQIDKLSFWKNMVVDERTGHGATVPNSLLTPLKLLTLRAGVPFVQFTDEKVEIGEFPVAYGVLLYESKTVGAHIPCKVKKYSGRGEDFQIEIDCKPGYLMPLREQCTRLKIPPQESGNKGMKFWPFASSPDNWKRLPKWIYNEKVLELAKKHAVVPMGCAVGPAMFWGYCANISVWVILVFLPVAVRRYSVIADGFPVYNYWIWVALIPFIVFRLLCEFKCLLYTTIPCVQVFGAFRAFGRSMRLDFWLATSLALTFLNIFDHCTDCMFFGVVWKMYDSEADVLQAVWHQTMQQSIWQPLMDYTGWGISLRWLFLTSWLFILLQGIVPLILSTPWCDRVDYKVAMKESDPDLKLNFQTLVNADQNLGDALYSLGEGSGMASLMNHHPYYGVHKIRQLLAIGFKGCAFQCAHVHVRGGIIRGACRLFLCGLLESVVQINLQLTILAISKHLTGTVSLQTALGAGLSILLTFPRVLDGWQFASVAQQSKREIQQFLEYREDKGDEKAIDREFFIVNCFVVFVYIIMAVMVLNLLYAFVKLWAAFHCPNGLFNLLHGCVVID